MTISIERTTHPTNDAHALIEELEAELSEGYEAHQRHGLSVEKVFQPHIAFFIARAGGDAVGCGGVAFDDGFAEVKRMYVRRSARGTGVAQAVLARLEQEARAKGYGRLMLETGDTLTAAMRLYEREGFHACEAFGPYRAMRREQIERSRFFEKVLS
ncbi:MAG: GNAT family N-acetyltransferase [Alphaproteobacteria bacterium]|jgi:putative acetyltransferase|nr:GNAT family N-acetyltransferase [Alphaproteobacteria bacterium]